MVAVSPAPRPSPRHYAILGQRHGATVAACVEAFWKLDTLYDPRAWPGADQTWAIAMQDEVDEALSVIVDAERLAGVGA
jgi:hypothetical protein